MVLSPLLVVLILSPQMFNWCPFSTDVQWLSSFLSLSVVPPLLHHSMAILCPQLVGGCPFSSVTYFCFFLLIDILPILFCSFFVKISLLCLLKKFAVSKLHVYLSLLRRGLILLRDCFLICLCWSLLQDMSNFLILFKKEWNVRGFYRILKTWLSNELIEIMVWDFEYHLLHATAQLFKNSFCMENGNLRSYFDLYWLFFSCNSVACIHSSIFGPCSIFYKHIHKERNIILGINVQ